MIAASGLLFAACGDDTDSTADEPVESVQPDGMADDTAATAASNNPLLSTLVDAVVAADLVDTLNSDGPFTIFAPTNDAFAAIPTADLEAVLADVDLLTSILTFHVIAGDQLSSDDLVAAGSATTICQDVSTANASVHIIDSVLMP